MAIIMKQVDNEILRFWSPIETGSMAIFYIKDLIKPIPNEKELELDNANYMTCWDGCFQ